MKQSTQIILGKIAVIFLIIFAITGCLIFVQAQNPISPQNPLTEQADNRQIPRAQTTTTEVAQEILDMEADVTEAESEEYEESDLIPEENINNNIEYEAIALSSSENSNNNEDNNENHDNSPSTSGETQNEQEPPYGEDGGADVGIDGDGDDESSDNGEGDDGEGDGQESDKEKLDDETSLPTNINYFVVNILNYQETYRPDDPRCHYQITHLQPELKVEEVVIINNDTPLSHFGGTANRGWFNLVSGENWVKVRVTYRFPNGDLRTFERATSPAMLKLYDPLDIDFEDNNLRNSYTNPDISFYLNPTPSNAQVQVLLDGNRIRADKAGNYNVTLKEGENQFVFKGTANGWNDTTITRIVTYYKTQIRVYSPELAQLDTRTGGGLYYGNTIDFTVVVEDIETGQPISGVKLDISIRGKREYLGDSDNNTILTLPIKYGQNEIIISARGVDSNNNSTDTVSERYYIEVGQNGEIPPQVLADTDPGANIPDSSITHNPVFNFSIAPTTRDQNGNLYVISESNTIVTHTYIAGGRESTIRVTPREVVYDTYYYSIPLREGSNQIKVVLKTDEGYAPETIYELIYVPLETTPEPNGTIFISVEAAPIGMPYLTGGYVDIAVGESLANVIERFLKTQGYQLAFAGQSNYSMYLRYIIKDNMMAAWNDTMLSDEYQALIEASGAEWNGGYDINSLGEFDFTNRAGWVATINGSPIGGMTTTIPQNGDECRLMFTLTGGSDVGL